MPGAYGITHGAPNKNAFGSFWCTRPADAAVHAGQDPPGLSLASVPQVVGDETDEESDEESDELTHLLSLQEFEAVLEMVVEDFRDEVLEHHLAPGSTFRSWVWLDDAASWPLRSAGLQTTSS